VLVNFIVDDERNSFNPKQNEKKNERAAYLNLIKITSSQRLLDSFSSKNDSLATLILLSP